MYPQLKYIRECRKDPLFVEHELELQRIRRKEPRNKQRKAEYMREYRKRKSNTETTD